MGARSQCTPETPAPLPTPQAPALSLLHGRLSRSSHSGLFSLQPRSRALQVLSGHFAAVQGCGTVVLPGEPALEGWQEQIMEENWGGRDD